MTETGDLGVSGKNEVEGILSGSMNFCFCPVRRLWWGVEEKCLVVKLEGRGGGVGEEPGVRYFSQKDISHLGS